MNFSDDDLKEAADLIRNGELVAFPTETVYGLGADATNSKAIEKIYVAKKRPSDNPLIVHVSGKEMLLKCVDHLPPIADELIKKFWPGPLTLVFNRSQYISPSVTKGLDTVAIRCPNHQIALRLISISDKPIAAPSANLSGRPSPTSAEHVIEDLFGRIPLIIDGGTTQIGLESTVVSLVSNPPIMLRPGGVTLEELKAIIPDIQTKAENEIAKLSPGTRYTHYSPRKDVYLLTGFTTEKEIEIYLNGVSGDYVLFCTNSVHSHPQKIPHILLGKSKKEIQQNLFSYLRNLDTMKYESAYIEEVEPTEEGLAIMNRLTKAAKKIIRIN